MRILIVDDHTLVQSGISELVNSLGGFEVVGGAENGKEALEFTDMLKPDIVLMDVDMPVMNGLEATIELKKRSPETKVIILTMHGDPSLIKRMMEIGASGFLLKNSDRSEFETALKRVAEGKTYFSGDAARAVITGENVTPGNFTVGTDALLFSKLSEREREILKLIAQGMSNKEIGEELFISHRTVDSHRTNLMKKLQVHNSAALVKLAASNGLV
ncbi:response regulator transcription factor [Cryomorphaceae bacterium 1068]|nr:response regulator transcription factor [Cryomorphaceae bacterium 1068]